MAEDPNPPEVVPVAPGTSAPEDKGNESTPPAGMSLEDINKLTGRTYTTLEDAQKGIKETYGFVGAKPKEIVKEVVKEVIPKDVVTREEFQTSEFFRDNADANKHRDLVTTVAKANGISVQDAFKSEFVQNTIKQLNVADEASKARSALTSNPRLGIVSDDATKAKEAFEGSQKARAAQDPVQADRLQREAETHALSAVIKAFSLDGKKITD